MERGSGDLYRFPKESLIPGASPSIVKESRGASVLLKISEDPFITTFKARLMCAQHNVEPNFCLSLTLAGGGGNLTFPRLCLFARLRSSTGAYSLSWRIMTSHV